MHALSVARHPSAFSGPREATPASSSPTSPRRPGFFEPRTGSATQLPAFQPAPQPHLGVAAPLAPPSEASAPGSEQQEPPTPPPEKLAFEPPRAGDDALDASLPGEEGPRPTIAETLMDLGATYFLTIIGAFLLAMVVLTPIWDSCRLLYSSTYVYFIGRVEGFWTIVFCSAVIVFFIVSMLAMERLGRRKVKKDQTFMYIFTSTITTLGLGLIVLSWPLKAKTSMVYDQLMVHPSTGPSTEPLYAYYHMLLTMRLKPDCLKKQSVEECLGYEERSPYTGFLKHMELTYECSGFGYAANVSSTLAISPKPAVLLHQSQHDYVGFLQASGGVSLVKAAPSAEETRKKLAVALQRRPTKKSRARLRQHQPHASQWLSLFSGNHTMSKTVPAWDKLPRGVGNTANNMVATGWMKAYPPTLYTNANYATTCEGAAARDLRFTALETARLMHLEGTALLLASIGVGFLKLCSMFRTREDIMEDKAQKKLAALSASGDGQYQPYAGT